MQLKSRNGKLYLHFSHDKKTVRKSLRLEDTAKNRQFAKKQIIPEIQKQLVLGEFFKSTTIPTVDEYQKVSFASRKSDRRKQTQREYESIYQIHISPVLGKKRLDEICASDLKMWQSDLQGKLSAKRVQTIRGVLNTIFADAYLDEIINLNPLQRVKPPKSEPAKQIRPFTESEIFAIIQSMPKHLQSYTAIGFFTGMRVGEIIALKWGDVDFENRRIEVKRSRRDGVDGKTKTASSIRSLDIIDVLLPYFQRHWDNYKHQVYLFETRDGKAYANPNKILQWYWQPTLKKLGIKYRIQYQMRHTFASMMISNGEDILWVSKMLGHSTPQMTLEKYAKYIPDKTKNHGVFLTQFAQTCTKTAQ